MMKIFQKKKMIFNVNQYCEEMKKKQWARDFDIIAASLLYDVTLNLYKKYINGHILAFPSSTTNKENGIEEINIYFQNYNHFNLIYFKNKNFPNNREILIDDNSQNKKFVKKELKKIEKEIQLKG